MKELSRGCAGPGAACRRALLRALAMRFGRCRQSGLRGARAAASAASTLALAAVLTGCASGPPTPGWQLDARAAMDRAVAAALAGDARTEAQEMERARAQIARTGRPGLLARAELMHCAARVASLEFGPCAGFEALRADADAAELAYADHLQSHALPADAVARLPAAQQPVAAVLQAIADPQSRLIAAAVLFQAGRAGPGAITLAADTASAQGWRRPLLAWLGVQALRAERAGAADEAQRLRRRIALVQGG